MASKPFSIKILSDGTYKLDGGSVFGPVPKVMWEEKVTADRKNRIKMGLNCLLLQNDSANILIDTGVGTKEPLNLKEFYGLSSGRLVRQLKTEGLTPKDISAVILSHLHFDHAGGATRFDRSGFPVPTFPKAKYYVQNAAWNDAMNPNERARAGYHNDDLYPLKESGQLEIITGNTEIYPGISVQLTNGHTRGHQIVLMKCGGERVVFLGDLVPTKHHLGLPCITSFDYAPEQTLEQKRSILEQAEKDGWMIIFPHALEDRAGYIERRNGKPQLRVVDL
ncbi:MAG: MBL fold metallo-hydrolase [Dehalococcoidia bacterium]|nr:MBL fold metallo-hydrolase [Dehalococcoidia bacterium]